MNDDLVSAPRTDVTAAEGGDDSSRDLEGEVTRL